MEVTITFVRGTRLLREGDRPSQLPIHRNGPPGTFVVFPDGLRVSLPTDQIVNAIDADGCARVGFGGMRFLGEDARGLTFARERELWPEEQLSPARSHTMVLNPLWVQTIHAAEVEVWPSGREP